MYCRKCSKDKKGVNMKVDLKKKTYGCPKCSNVVKWDSKNSLNWINLFFCSSLLDIAEASRLCYCQKMQIPCARHAALDMSVKNACLLCLVAFWAYVLAHFILIRIRLYRLMWTFWDVYLINSIPCFLQSSSRLFRGSWLASILPSSHAEIILYPSSAFARGNNAHMGCWLWIMHFLVSGL